jgi:hypothetical protein
MQNKKKIIQHLIGNLSNAIVHKILENAIKDLFISQKYEKEILNSFEVAKSYRSKLNPVDKGINKLEFEKIKKEVSARVRNEIELRRDKGYKNLEGINIEKEVLDFMMKLNLF